MVASDVNSVFLLMRRRKVSVSKNNSPAKDARKIGPHFGSSGDKLIEFHCHLSELKVIPVAPFQLLVIGTNAKAAKNIRSLTRPTDRYIMWRALMPVACRNAYTP